MTVLEIISGSEAFHETALSFLKEFQLINQSIKIYIAPLQDTHSEFAGRRSYSEITNDYQEFVMLTMVVLLGLSSINHWRALGPIRYAHWIAKLLYDMKINIFCNQYDQEGPKNPLWYVSI